MKISSEKKEQIKALIDGAIFDGSFPCASVLAGTRENILFEYYAGNKSVYPETTPLDANTLFDMASLTKVLTTAPLAMIFVDKGLISLADKVSYYLPQFSTDAGKSITLGQLLTHTAGFIPHIPLYNICNSQHEAIDKIAEIGIQHTPGKQVIYSDLGFITLGRILEIVGNDTLDNLSNQYLYRPLGMDKTGFNPSSENTASTEKNSKTDKWLNGVVHDGNARFLDGVAGHAGLFSYAKDIEKYAVMLLNYGKHGSKQIISEASTKAMITNVTYSLGEDRSLGWTVKAARVPGTDSYSGAGGELAPPGSYGHTGFTGTSIWLDNNLGVYIVCLTNRVHYGRENTKIIRFRRLLHNMFFASLEH
jgi:CubicO group peptidase (beta-lactamase class C family)